jgi:putative cardiolipin synthase
MAHRIVSQFGIILSVTLILFGCSTLPINRSVTQVEVLPSDHYSNTLLAQTFSSDRLDGFSGNLLLRNGHQALVERLYLIDAAEKNIDAQYFLWNNDNTGKLLLQRLILAANRGVAIRVLIDGFSITEHHKQLAYLATHPNVDIRVYNPIVGSQMLSRVVNFATGFDRLNQRMHNKSFVFDGNVAITGGRNIGDAYFFYDEHYNFYDMDVFSVGPVVNEVTSSFNNYWGSPWAIPIDYIYKTQRNDESRAFLDALIKQDFSYFLKFDEAKAVASISFLTNYYQQLSKKLIWAPTEFIYDKPGGIEPLAEDQPKVVAVEIAELVRRSQVQVLIESAYFVLDKRSIEIFKQLDQNGVDVKVLTNSMASNNLLMNHAGYAMVRENILDTGAEIYELKPSIESCLAMVAVENNCKHHLVGLHAKTAVFDRKSVYIGSLNFNMRSAFINTEAALVIESPEIAAELAEIILQNMTLANSWQAILHGDDVAWMVEQNQQIALVTQEPSTNWLERIGVDLFSWIPGAEYY